MTGLKVFYIWNIWNSLKLSNDIPEWTVLLCGLIYDLFFLEASYCLLKWPSCNRGNELIKRYNVKRFSSFTYYKPVSWRATLRKAACESSLLALFLRQRLSRANRTLIRFSINFGNGSCRHVFLFWFRSQRNNNVMMNLLRAAGGGRNNLIAILIIT